MKPKRPVNKVSPRQRKRLAEYRNAKAAWWLKLLNTFGLHVPCCWPGCSRHAELGAPHHTHGRLGSLLCDDRLFRPLCQLHHSAIHTDPLSAAAARAVGLLAPRGWWNRNPFEVKR